MTTRRLAAMFGDFMILFLTCGIKTSMISSMYGICEVVS